jgi:uncharacterized protein YjbI with pentapeptide repeats
MESQVISRKKVKDLLRKKMPLDSLDLRGADLEGVQFDDASLRWAKLAEANLRGCSFRRADLTGASLWNANLSGAVFEAAILDEADLDMADLDGCTFKNARIRKAIFPSQAAELQQVQSSIRTGDPVRLCEPALPTD